MLINSSKVYGHWPLSGTICRVFQLHLHSNHRNYVDSTRYSRVTRDAKYLNVQSMSRRPLYSTSSDILSITTNNDPLRELFEACKAGDLIKVKKLVTLQTVNARDTAGRKSTPLHFAAGTYHHTFT